MEVKAGNTILRIKQDDCFESPREWDNLGTIAYKHKNYNLGEEKIENPIDWLIDMLEFNEDEVAAFVHEHGREDLYSEENKVALENEFLKKFVALPLYLYEHGGITIATKPFGCKWDSGQVGYVYVTEEKMKEEYDEVTDENKAKALRVLESEIKTFDQYVTGEIYGFELVEVNTCKECGHESEEHIDSCWGFYGSNPFENGIVDNICSEEHGELIEKLKEKY